MFLSFSISSSSGLTSHSSKDADGDHPDGFGQSLKITCTTADTSLASIEEVQFLTKVEGFDTQDFAKGTSSAKQFSVSF